MVDTLLLVFLIIIFILVVACCCFFQVRRACCWFERVQIDATWAQIRNAIRAREAAEMTEQKENRAVELTRVGTGDTTSSDESGGSFTKASTFAGREKPKMLGEMSKRINKTFRVKGSQVLDADGKPITFLNDEFGAIQNEELKKDERGFYIERKWQIRQRTICAKWAAMAWNNVLNNSVLWWVLTFVVIGFVAFYGGKIDASFRDAISVYILAFVGLFSVLISLLFSNGIEKNKENKRLFDALCGDVKGMAMWVSGLMNERSIYDYYPKDKKKVTDPVYRIDAKENYEVECAKIRLLLSVLAPVAKHVLRDSETNRADYDMLDDKYRIKVYYSDQLMKWSKQNGCLSGWFPPEVVKDTTQTWAKMGGDKKKDKKDDDGIVTEKVFNPIKYYLYEKIKMVQDKSKMDLFEVVMYVLLDTINGLSEMEFIETYGKERDLISKWQHIYGSWGTMSSLTTYSQPFFVHLTIVFSLLLYMVGITLLNKHEAVTKFKEIDGSACCGSEDWVEEGRDTFYIWFYVIVKSFVQIFPFTWFWFLSKLIGKPFKKGYPDADIISKTARDTQYQVSNLMTNRAAIDGWDKGYDYRKLMKACDRESINCGNLYMNTDIDQTEYAKRQAKKRIQGRRNKDRRRSVRWKPIEEGKDDNGDLNSTNSEGSESTMVRIDLPDTGVQRRVIRYKNVNF